MYWICERTAVAVYFKTYYLKMFKVEPLMFLIALLESLILFFVY